MMAPQVASIQSFFQPEIPSSTSMKQPPSSVEVSDGFTSSEIQTTLHPRRHKWHPRSEYEEMNIAELAPGPGCVTVTGRIVNFFELANTSKAPLAARGSFKIIVKDDTGAFTVRA